MKTKVKNLLKICIFIALITLNTRDISPNSQHINENEMVPFYLKVKREGELNNFNKKLKKEKPYLFVLGIRESWEGPDTIPNYTAYNKFGYLGAWQIHVSYLPSLGIHGVTLEEFIKNPDGVFPFEIQLQAVETLIEKNIDHLGWYFDYYPGKRARGINITKEGMIYGAHLGGAYGLKKFLRYGINPSDVYGTSIKDYLNYKNTFWYQL